MTCDFVTDDEMFKRLRIKPDIGRVAVMSFEKQPAGMPFPARDPLFGGRRFWPAVVQFFLVRYGVAPRALAGADARTWEENFDVSISPARKASRPTSARPELAQTR